MHIRIQQRNGKKSLTTVQVRNWFFVKPLLQSDDFGSSCPDPVSDFLQGLEKGFDYNKVLKAFKKGDYLVVLFLLLTCPSMDLGLV